jgi:phospholipid/cholesterol/gamma-HCH transport system permease protein
MRVTELGAVAVKPLRSAGGFFAFSLDTLITMVKPPFAWREFLEQTVFLA